MGRLVGRLAKESASVGNRIPQAAIPCSSPVGFSAVASAISPAAETRKRIPAQTILGNPLPFLILHPPSSPIGQVERRATCPSCDRPGPGIGRRLSRRNLRLCTQSSKSLQVEPWDAGWRFSTALWLDRSVAGGPVPNFAACRH